MGDFREALKAAMTKVGKYYWATYDSGHLDIIITDTPYFIGNSQYTGICTVHMKYHHIYVENSAPLKLLYLINSYKSFRNYNINSDIKKEINNILDKLSKI